MREDFGMNLLIMIKSIFMKAKKVFENIDFKRGQDPRDALGLGPFYNIPLDEITVKDIMDKLEFKWDRVLEEEDTNSEGDTNYYDVWVKDGVELATMDDVDDEYNDIDDDLFVWNITTGLTFDVAYTNHDDILNQVKENMYE